MRWVVIALAGALAGCPVADAECFGHDECGAGARCVGRECVTARDAGPAPGRDGGVDARDAGEVDAGARDAGEADAGARDGGEADAGARDAGEADAA